jgi:putative endonuclease
VKVKSAHHYTGKEGEALAIRYLQQNGFAILHCNWRFARYETDIIAEKAGILHFVEVKTRRTTTFGYPEESVSAKKLKHMLRCAAAYQGKYPGWKRIQFDVLSVSLQAGQPAAYFFIEDVYL